jgi:pimeloyl-ACP methyl ester carboxylesterase
MRALKPAAAFVHPKRKSLGEAMNRRLWLIMVLASLASVPGIAAGTAEVGEPRIEPVVFTSHGVELSGSIAYPAHEPAVAAVVFIHGSGKQTRNLVWARRFAQAGIAALVYDKRGAGDSGGEYEERQSVSGPNISLLADDAVAALQALASRPSLKGVPVGFSGISQAGWIAPLAAERSRAARFLVLWSGPVCKVSEEDIYSKFTRDSDMKPVPSYRQALASRTEKYVWPAFLGVDTDPDTSLSVLSIPGLWIFGGQDGSIPVDLSIARLQSLKDRGHRYEYVLLPEFGHNNMDGTFGTATDWIRRLN